MTEALLQAENKFLRARIEFLELKLKTEQEQEPQEEFVDLDQLCVPQLKDICGALGHPMSSARRRGHVLGFLQAHFDPEKDRYSSGYYGLNPKQKMKAIVEAVKDLQSKGYGKDIIIQKKLDD